MSLSPDGVLWYGGGFVDVLGRRPPATIELAATGKQDGGKWANPQTVAFSAFSSDRSAGRSSGDTGETKRKTYAAGGHAALGYNGVDTFFSVVVVRCDTWAIQWGVSRAECLERAVIHDLITLTAHTVCGLYSPDSGSKERRLFYGSRLDVPLVRKQENREWRSFMASPRPLHTGMEKESIIALAVASATSFFALTRDGAVHLVSLEVPSRREKVDPVPAVRCTKVTQVSLKKNASGAASMVFSGGSDHAFLLVYAKGGTSFDVVNTRGFSHEAPHAVSRQTVALSQPQGPLERVEFAGPHHIVATCGSPNQAASLQFFTVIPGEATEAAEIIASPIVPLHRPPIATFYDANGDTHTVVCGSASAADAESLVQCTLSLAAGPYSADVVESASWQPVISRHYEAPPTLDEGERQQLYKDLRALHIAESSANGAARWAPLKLFYALTTSTTVKGAGSAGGTLATAVFAVTIAPYLHTRLVKQWHNATAGLHALLDKPAGCANPYALAWNPRHLRRALRLMSQAQLSHAFQLAAGAMRASSSTAASDEAVTYAEAATASVDIALHIITLSRQTGAALSDEDVETVVLLLRASRETGHVVLRHSSRMELLLDSCLQQRAMNRLLGRKMTPAAFTTTEEEEEKEHTSADGGTALAPGRGFFGLPGDLRAERALRTRYTANAWAQNLQRDAARHHAAASRAAELLQGLSEEGRGAHQLSDWESIGRRPHPDAVLTQFESTLVRQEEPQ